MNKYFNIAVVKELYREWLKWTLWYFIALSVVRIIHATTTYIGDTEPSSGHFIYFMHQPSRIYMLIIGIMTAYVFLRYYLQHGITRRTYVIGTVISSALISLSIVALTYIVSWVEHVIIGMLGIDIGWYLSSQATAQMASNEAIHLFSYFFIFGLSIWFYFMIGWMIGQGFYRYGWFRGLSFIALAIITVFIKSFIWGNDMMLFGISLDSSTIPIPLSFIMTGVLLALFAWLNYRLARNIRVKMH